jgi:DNA-binding transcriptional LysR family regulator
MDTRQLAAFCAVVELHSFSHAAERLGVTQPAVSMQIRALEERFGQRLLDRSGRRVEPTEAGQRLYRGAQRLIALEEQLQSEVASVEEGELRGRLEIGSSTGPGDRALPLLLCEFQRQSPAVSISLSVFDTQTVVERVAERELELGVVGAARKHRGVVFEPFFRDDVVLACRPEHPFADRTISLEELRREPLIVMQEGGGVRQLLEDELRKHGVRLRDLDIRLELGLQESVRSAVIAGYGIGFISRSALESELAAGQLACARVEGLDPAREIMLVQASGRSLTRVAEAFLAFARERLTPEQ